jgi:quercetin dioxygenase-like cupin family protein
MEVFHFEKEVGRKIHQYDSNFFMSRLGKESENGKRQNYTTGDISIGCMYLEKDGVVGYHQATVPQLFLVVQGDGWVRGKDKERLPIKAGQAAFWEAGEWHESGTDTGMVVIVVESENIHPQPFSHQPMISGHTPL